MEGLSRDLLRISRKAQICVGTVIKKYNISVAEEPFFMTVNFHNGATQEELTELVGVDKAMTTRVIHSLESKGMIKKITDPEDRRRNRIYKTEKMDEISGSIMKELLRLNHIFTSGISNDALEGFMQTLASLEENISKFLKENK